MLLGGYNLRASSAKANESKSKQIRFLLLSFAFFTFRNRDFSKGYERKKQKKFPAAPTRAAGCGRAAQRQAPNRALLLLARRLGRGAEGDSANTNRYRRVFPIYAIEDSRRNSINHYVSYAYPCISITVFNSLTCASSQKPDLLVLAFAARLLEAVAERDPGAFALNDLRGVARPLSKMIAICGLLSALRKCR